MADSFPTHRGFGSSEAGPSTVLWANFGNDRSGSIQLAARRNMFEHGIIGHDPQLARSILGSFNRCLRWITLAYLVAVVAIHSVPGPLEPVRLAGPLLVLATSFLFQNLLPRGRIHAASILMLVVVYLAMLPRLLSQGVASSASFLVLASIPLASVSRGTKPISAGRRIWTRSNSALTTP